MGKVAFRTHYPYNKNVVPVPIVITDDTPTFTLLNEFIITDNLPAGEYILIVSYEWFMPDTNDSALYRILSPLTVGTIYNHEPKDASEVLFRTSASPFTWAGGPITFRLEASTTVGANDLTVNWSSIEFERKA